jgi:hypothetical protein
VHHHLLYAGFVLVVLNHYGFIIRQHTGYAQLMPNQLVSITHRRFVKSQIRQLLPELVIILCLSQSSEDFAEDEACFQPAALKLILPEGRLGSC